MNLLLGLCLLLLLAIPLAVAILRSNELFCVDVREGKPRFVRGRLPQRLLDDIADVVRRPPIVAARLRVVTEDGRPRLVLAAGRVPEGQLQQLRNVIGSFKVAEIRAGGRPRR